MGVEELKNWGTCLGVSCYGESIIKEHILKVNINLKLPMEQEKILNVNFEVNVESFKSRPDHHDSLVNLVNMEVSSCSI